jgi:hypothetical protein
LWGLSLPGNHNNLQRILPGMVLMTSQEAAQLQHSGKFIEI